MDLASLEEEVTRVEGNYESIEAAASQAAEKYQNAIAGVADETNSDLLSLPEQVGAWEKRAREAESLQQQGAEGQTRRIHLERTREESQGPKYQQYQ